MKQISGLRFISLKTSQKIFKNNLRSLNLFFFTTDDARILQCYVPAAYRKTLKKCAVIFYKI